MIMDINGTKRMACPSNNSRQVVWTYASLSPSSIIWYRSRGGDALRLEGNCRSGVTPAMHHRLCGLSTYGLNGHCVGDEYLAYALGARHLYLTCTCTRTWRLSTCSWGLRVLDTALPVIHNFILSTRLKRRCSRSRLTSRQAKAFTGGLAVCYVVLYSDVPKLKEANSVPFLPSLPPFPSPSSSFFVFHIHPLSHFPTLPFPGSGSRAPVAGVRVHYPRNFLKI